MTTLEKIENCAKKGERISKTKEKDTTQRGSRKQRERDERLVMKIRKEGKGVWERIWGYLYRGREETQIHMDNNNIVRSIICKHGGRWGLRKKLPIE